MAHTIKQAKCLADFHCLGDKCEDTCCRGWGMQLDPERKALYEQEAPELLDAVTTGEAALIMRRDPKTDYCIKFENGWCSIHKEYGEKFLGDACHFYPRITRNLGDVTYRSAALSCPEISRLMLFGDDPFSIEETIVDRLPSSLKHYGPDTLSGEERLTIVQTCIDIAGDEHHSAEHNLATLFTILTSLCSQPETKWPEGIDFYRKISENILPTPQQHFADGYRLVNILIALINAAPPSDRPRLNETVETMEKALNMHVDRETFEIINLAGNDTSAYDNLKAQWKAHAAQPLSPVLKRWIQAQISMACFPFAGFGNDIHARKTILGVRFATVKLALMAHMHNDTPPDENTIIKVIQSLSRFYDHLADPTLSMAAYEESGWTNDAHMRGLIGDCNDASNACQKTS